jgi:UDP-N-acetylenolpyruvoylglucosamine reductase
MNTSEVSLYKNTDMNYEYRESELKDDRSQFVIDMVLDITPKGGEYESYTPANLQSLRKLKQPPGFSCGSFFKNPKLEEFHEFI